VNGDCMKSCMSVSEAAKVKKVTRQAIYLAIRLKRLRAYKQEDKWQIFMSDLKEYDKNKFSRVHHSKINGKPVFDEEKGYMSVDTAAKKLNVPKQTIYYAVRTGKLKASRKNAAWVIHVKDLIKYKDTFLKKGLHIRCASAM